MIRFLASRSVLKLQCADAISDDNADDGRHPHTPGCITQGLSSCLVMPSARAYGSQVQFHPLRIRRAARIACSEPQRLV